MKAELLEVPQGKIASVVTHLEMTARPAPRPVPEVDVTLERQPMPEVAWYRDLFRRVGGENWLWFSRLTMGEEALAAVLTQPGREVYALRYQGRDEGLLELDFTEAGACELAYFGVTDALIGMGAGRWLMAQALDLAWAQDIQRFHLHTCTLDSPQALPFYLRSGFRAHRRQVEIADDPRLMGLLPMDAAPQVPVI